MGMLNRLYTYRFEIFLFSQLSILFGSLITPTGIFENLLSPILFQINLFAGILLISKKKSLMWFLLTLVIISVTIFGSSMYEKVDHQLRDFLHMATFFLYYLIITYEIVNQVWKAKATNKTVIYGLISGYISLGLIGFFICLSIEMQHPGSFQGSMLTGASDTIEGLMYYSFITLLTIGYGDILPMNSLAQKAAILIGLMGQFYLVVLTAIVVGKFVSQRYTEIRNPE